MLELKGTLGAPNEELKDKETGPTEDVSLVRALPPVVTVISPLAQRSENTF